MHRPLKPETAAFVNLALYCKLKGCLYFGATGAQSLVQGDASAAKLGLAKKKLGFASQKLLHRFQT